MTVNIRVGKTQLLSMDNDGDCHMIGYHGSARFTGKSWALYDVDGELCRYTGSEQSAVDHCMGY